ncbi:hypothetical protein DFR48_10735 [Ciceribacter lividus]|uniref:Uncharacterized protein n=1 Tax=Ciceribacter lividus TaxID=1197950 RepID=A0A6I7HKY1_9HYPH|nr:hypothetical protein [Ciceribacter lividus]RCW23166.1 hypothetical protein DFR48_10735 [Ciceribacter lividus]
MKNLLATVCAAALLVCSNSAHAEESEDLYYTGSFVCSGQEYATDWNISKGLSGEVATTVYYQQLDSNQVEWLELTERKGPNGHQLYDANGNPRIGLIADGQTIRAIWMAGSPMSDCSPFAVSRSQSAKDRFDELFALMETPEPSDDIAAKVADRTRLPPIIYALPELDRQSYMQRYSELEEAFWTRYRETVVKDIASRPLATDEDKKAFAERLFTALSDTSRFMRRRDGLEATSTMMQQAADRYAASGGAPAEALYVGKEIACQRLQGILKADPYFNFAKLELAVGLPSDYWTRALAENLLSGMRNCDEVSEDYAHQLLSKWPEIQEKQKLVLSLLKEQSRLLALPVTMDTLVETKNLQPDEMLVQSISRHSSDYQRFFGVPLDARREELLNVSLASIGERSARYSIDQPEMATAVSEACEILDDLSDMAGDRRDMIRQTCESANETIAAKQSEQAVAQVNAAFADAAPDTAAAEAADKLCNTLPSTLSNRAASKVYDVCSDAKKVMAEKKDALKCEQAIASSGASSELLESSVSVRESGGSSNAAVKDLICNATKMGAQLSFATSGYLAWKTHSMDMKMERAREGEGLLHFVLTPSEGDADWVVGTEDENTKAILAKQGAKVEIVTACIMRTTACHP